MADEESDMPTHSEPPTDDPRWLDRPGSVGVVIRILAGLSALSVLADFFYHKHGEYGFQEWFAFDAIYGFVACVGLVLTAKIVRKVLMRSEDYYDR
jgi:hypothetical protein